MNFAWAVFRRMLLLLVVWLALWQSLSIANILSGLLVAGVLIAMFPPRRSVPAMKIRPLRILHLLGVFAVSLVKSSTQVAIETLRPRIRVREAFVRVPATMEAPFGLATVSALISLVPGTVLVAVEGEPKSYFIHVFNFVDAETEIRDIERYERLGTAAFGPMTEPDRARHLGGDAVSVHSGAAWSFDSEEET